MFPSPTSTIRSVTPAISMCASALPMSSDACSETVPVLRISLTVSLTSVRLTATMLPPEPRDNSPTPVSMALSPSTMLAAPLDTSETVPAPLLATVATPGKPFPMVMPEASMVRAVPSPPATTRPPLSTVIEPLASRSTLAPDTVPKTITDEFGPLPAEI